MSVDEAVMHIWVAREDAALRQSAAGRTDAGSRSEVTSGGHMDQISSLVADAFTSAGIPAAEVHAGRSGLELPGYFRPEKKWDIVVLHEGALVAAVELKAIASSYGKNMNNRAEEALGNAVDIGHAVKVGLIGSLRPWLGYVFVMRDESSSRMPVGVRQPHFPVDRQFLGATYQERSRLMCRRLVSEGLYDRTWFVTADPVSGTVNEPDPEMTWAKFRASIRGKVGEVLA